MYYLCYVCGVSYQCLLVCLSYTKTKYIDVSENVTCLKVLLKKMVIMRRDSWCHSSDLNQVAPE
jgi:hypothetical protein